MVTAVKIKYFKKNKTTIHNNNFAITYWLVIFSMPKAGYSTAHLFSDSDSLSITGEKLAIEN